MVVVASDPWQRSLPRTIDSFPPTRQSRYGETSRRSSRWTHTRAEADEGARLENDSGELHRVTLKHLFAQLNQQRPAAESLSM
jgi:hypothetical protein